MYIISKNMKCHPTDECPCPEEAIINVSSFDIDARADSIPPARL